MFDRLRTKVIVAISTSLLGLAMVGCPPTTPEDFLSADVVKGGGMYDKWWVAASATEPTVEHPFWSTQSTNTRTGSTTWRCKECHGWDYKGADGAYDTDNSHFTGFTGIFATTLSPQQVFDELKTGHSFGGMTNLTDADLWDLTKFVKEGQLDIDDILDDAGVFIGASEDGDPLYAANCSGCHGADGLSEVTPGFDAFPGFLSNENPWEFQHKVRFGQPGTGMPALLNLITQQEVANLSAFAQTLPTVAP